MAVKVRVRDGVAVLDWSGDMRIGMEDVELRNRFEELLDQGHRCFVLNLARVRFMDSAAIGETVACYQRARDLGGTVKIVLIRRSKPEDVLKITSLDRVFEIFGDEEEAVRSFNAPRAVV